MSAARRFGEYTLLEPLGEGGMGEVFLARRAGGAGAHRLCVIKTLRADLAKDPDYLQRFGGEARVAARLHHKNICAVFDVGIIDGTHYLAMELVRGVDLETVTQRLPPLPLPVALFIGHELLDALEHAHEATDAVSGAQLEVVHRDVSPHNVMITFEGEVKLIDFGLARSTLRADLTAEHVIVGKLRYMSPEQARGDRVDAKTDQYALAVVLYELVTGKRFYDDVEDGSLWKTMVMGGFLPSGLSTLPEPLRLLLTRALNEDPGKRFASCHDMRVALEALPQLAIQTAAGELARLLQQHLEEHSRTLRTRLAAASTPGSIDDSIDPGAPTQVRAVRPPTRAPETAAIKIVGPPGTHGQTPFDGPTLNQVPIGPFPLSDTGPLHMSTTVADLPHTQPALTGPVTQPNLGGLSGPVTLPGHPAGGAMPVTATLSAVAPDPRGSTPDRDPSWRRTALLLLMSFAIPAAAWWFKPTVQAPVPEWHDAGATALAPLDAGGGAPVVVADPVVAPPPVQTAPAIVDAGPAEEVKRPVVAPRPAPPRGSVLATLGYLERYCTRRVRCSAGLLRRRNDLDMMTLSEAQRYSADAEDCARRCGR